MYLILIFHNCILIYMAAKKTNKLGLGMILGAAAGALAGLFLAPKSGKELRKDAKDLSKTVAKSAAAYNKKLQKKTPEQIAKMVFGDMSDASMKLADRAHKQLALELEELGKKYKTIDKAKYTAAVKTVVANFKKDGSVPTSTLKKLGTYLQQDAKKLTARKKSVRKSTSTKKV